MDELGLEEPVEGLRGGVVIGVADGPNGRGDASLGDPFGVAEREVPGASVAVRDQPRQVLSLVAAFLLTLPDRLLEGVQREVRAQRRGHSPAHDTPGVKVHRERDTYTNPAQVGT